MIVSITLLTSKEKYEIIEGYGDIPEDELETSKCEIVALITVTFITLLPVLVVFVAAIFLNKSLKVDGVKEKMDDKALSDNIVGVVGIAAQ